MKQNKTKGRARLRAARYANLQQLVAVDGVVLPRRRVLIGDGVAARAAARSADC